ncbi:Hpt domain-containing protein [Nannocystis pusilla]|uniref:Hpt domain-containing protein n=1 Tax=Nannocystis pusilla TaxID=889268 RepID=UPI003BF0AFF5
MKVAVRGLAPEAALPLLWARGIEGAPGSSSPARAAGAIGSDLATSDVEGAPGSPSTGRDPVDSDLAASGPIRGSRIADVLLCDDADVPRADDPPRVVWTFGPLAPAAAAALVRHPPLALPAPEPEPAADASTAELLAAMRRDYTRQLPSSLAALARAVVAAGSGAAAPADARMLAHRLRGTAGSYGHPAIGELAGRLEQRLAAGDLSPAPLADLLLALAERIAAALSSTALAEQVTTTAASPPAALPARPRVAVVGPAPPGLPGGSIAAPDVPAAARAIEAGAAELLWVSLAGDSASTNMSKATSTQLAAAIAAEPVLRDIPVVLARKDGGEAATVALACLLAGAWGRLPLEFLAGDSK